jgi:hypothetical protein
MNVNGDLKLVRGRGRFHPGGQGVCLKQCCFAGFFRPFSALGEPDGDAIGQTICGDHT